MILIQNAHIMPIVGPELPNGCLLAEDGRITAVAPHIDAPEGCTVIDADGRLLTPGCVEAHCHIGLDNECLRWEGMDYNEIVDPLTPQLRAIDSINPQDGAFPNALRGGVTTACTGPGSANVVGGTFTVLKLAGKRVDNMLLKEPAAMKCAFGENPKGCYGQGLKKSPMTRMAVAALLRELLFKTRRYRDDKLAGKNPAFDMKLEAMLPVINGEIPLKCHAHRADDILTAVRIAKEFRRQGHAGPLYRRRAYRPTSWPSEGPAGVRRPHAGQQKQGTSCATRASPPPAPCTTPDSPSASSPTPR